MSILMIVMICLAVWFGSAVTAMVIFPYIIYKLEKAMGKLPGQSYADYWFPEDKQSWQGFLLCLFLGPLAGMLLCVFAINSYRRYKRYKQYD